MIPVLCEKIKVRAMIQMAVFEKIYHILKGYKKTKREHFAPVFDGIYLKNNNY
jgi:hypothetical protein